VVAALVEELGSDGLAFGGPLDKESPLKIAAKAYKVDDEKLLTAAKAQLESKRPKSDAEKKQAEKDATAKPGQMLKDALTSKPKPKKPKAAKPAKKKASKKK